MSRPFYRNDPVFHTWNTVESICHQKVQKSHPQLRSYFIDAMQEHDIRSVQNSNLVAITNSILDESFGNLESIFRVSNSFYGVYYHPYSIADHTPNKDFNCFINRMDAFRQSWLYQLTRRGLFDRGYLSFNMDITRMPFHQGLSQQIAFEKQFQQHCGIFAEEHIKLKNKVPYKNFQDNGDLTNVIIDSKFSIVLETYFDNNKIITYSEKIFRCLQLPRPWILFSHCGAVKHLREMGFDLLDDIVDHSKYDQLESPVDRQVTILDMVQQLVNININNYRERLISSAKRNQEILQKFSDTWQQDFDNVIKKAVEKLNA